MREALKTPLSHGAHQEMARNAQGAKDRCTVTRSGTTEIRKPTPREKETTGSFTENVSRSMEAVCPDDNILETAAVTLA